MKLVFATQNTDAFSSIDNPGRCSGMSADWAKKTFQYGSVRYPGMLSTAAADIASSAYMLMPAHRDRERVIESQGLNIGNYTQHGGPITAANVVEALLSLSGVFVWALEFTAGGGHFMGWRKDSGAPRTGPWIHGAKVEFFDPNGGMYSFVSAVDVQNNMVGLLTAYGGLSDFHTWSVTR